MNTAVNTEDVSYKFIKDNLDKIETPFENDFWGREALADRLTDHVSRITVGATIAIDAEWGAGKSWFVNNWKAKLEQNDFKVIYLNAFNQDYIDDPFLTISMEIANCLKTEETSIDAIKETIGKAYRAILPNLPMLLWYLTTSLVGMGALAKPVAETVEKLKSADDFGNEAAKLLNEKLQEHLSAQVENYDKEKQSLEYFKKALAEITSKLDKPLVFIVDELDRCKPEFAIRLIERIKHFFDIPKVVFILAVNKTQLEESINNFYGFSSTANYLEKFIDFSVMLRSKDLDGSRFFEILDSYNQDYQLSLKAHELNAYVALCKSYSPNPRQLVRIINKFSLLKSDLDEKRKAFLFIFLIYSELKLISSLSDKEFSIHFYDFHLKIYDLENINSYISTESNADKKANFLLYLSQNIYSKNSQTNLFDFLFRYILHYNLSPTELLRSEYKNLKNYKKIYFPIDDLTNDLIDEWYKYVHMIEG
ncbi:MAG: P-loop NTPase fold protein [Acinetobacter sp.]